LHNNTKGYRRILYTKVFNNAAIVHVISKYTKNLVMELFGVPEEKIKLIPPTIDFEKFASTKKADNTKIIIGTLTRFNKRKNVVNIIKALNILKEQFNLDFTYYLAGNGAEKNKIITELQNANFEWKYLGEISEKKKIEEFYPSLDVFVLPVLDLPNDVEGFGIVYLEANAYGIPVIASTSGGVPDAVSEGDSGEFANPDDPYDISEKIYYVLKNKNKYYDSSKKWAKNFDVEIIAKKFKKMYLENDIQN
jgi:phosphatidylinositol alpha-1,6-mannosyltransferase